jgi:hypothetical protein
VLALHLRRTVAELRATMSRAEFVRWWEFHRRNPLDPVSLYLRPAAVIAYTSAAHSANGTKSTFQSYMDSLAPRPDEDEAWEIFNSFLA